MPVFLCIALDVCLYKGMQETEIDYREALELAEKLANEAGEIQMEAFRGAFSIDKKSSRVDMVTEIDTRCERHITEGIRSHFCEHHIIGEEEGKSSRGSSSYTWVIDPLDGTTNFVHGLPVFAVSIALARGEEAVAGLVHVPPLGSTYSAVTGMGAWKDGERIRCAERARLSDGLLATGFPYDRAETPQNNVSYVSHLAPKVRGLRRVGAAAYDVCLVAEGVYDAYWELKVALWDILAGVVIAREAGAVVRYEENGDKYNVLASSSAMLPEICRELKTVGIEYQHIC